MSRSRVAITGIGVVSPFGVGRDVFWDRVSRGVSGTRAITGFDASHLPCRVAAAVPDEVIGEAIDEPAERPARPTDGRADPRRYAKVSRIAVLAAREALRDAGLDPGSPDIGVIVGSGAGGIDVAERQYGDYYSGDFHRVSPYAIPVSIVGIVSSEISIALGLARHQPRAVHRLHQLHRRDRLCRRADPARRGRRADHRRRRRLRHARHDLRLRPHARRVHPLQRSAGRGVAAVRPRSRRLRAGRRRVDAHARARGPRAGARRARSTPPSTATARPATRTTACRWTRTAPRSSAPWRSRSTAPAGRPRRSAT